MKRKIICLTLVFALISSLFFTFGCFYPRITAEATKVEFLYEQIDGLDYFEIDEETGDYLANRIDLVISSKSELVEFCQGKDQLAYLVERYNEDFFASNAICICAFVDRGVYNYKYEIDNPEGTFLHTYIYRERLDSQTYTEKSYVVKIAEVKETNLDEVLLTEFRNEYFFQPEIEGCLTLEEFYESGEINQEDLEMIAKEMQRSHGTDYCSGRVRNSLLLKSLILKAFSINENRLSHSIIGCLSVYNGCHVIYLYLEHIVLEKPLVIDGVEITKKYLMYAMPEDVYATLVQVE